MQCSGRRKWLKSQLGTQAAKTPGLVRAAVKLSQGSVRVNDGSGSGGGDQRRLVAALVMAKARKCRGRLCYGSGRDWNAQVYGRALVAQSCRALALAVAVTTMAEVQGSEAQGTAEAGSSGGSGDSVLR